MSVPVQLRKCVQNYYETRRLYSGHHIEREVPPLIPIQRRRVGIVHRSASERLIDQCQVWCGSNPYSEDDPGQNFRQSGELPFRED